MCCVPLSSFQRDFRRGVKSPEKHVFHSRGKGRKHSASYAIRPPETRSIPPMGCTSTPSPPGLGQSFLFTHLSMQHTRRSAVHPPHGQSVNVDKFRSFLDKSQARKILIFEKEDSWAALGGRKRKQSPWVNVPRSGDARLPTPRTQAVLCKGSHAMKFTRLVAYSVESNG